MTAVAGDALALKVVEKLADGSTQDVPETQVTWSSPVTVVASSPDAMPAATPYPATGGTDPVGIWISNPSRSDHATDLQPVLFILDAGSQSGGSIMVTASVTGAMAGQASAAVAVSAGPTGDATNGAKLYAGACAECHGSTGHGSPDSTDGMTYLIDGMPYSFPAPGLNAESGNAAAEWSPALFAIASRTDLDDGAVSLRLPMPNWLATPDPTTGKPLTTQDLADVFAFLATQSQ
jgi:hypothetical protein